MASSDCGFEQNINLQALEAALQHPAVAADQHNICTLLQVSKAWRAAVQQSAASLTDISLNKRFTLDSLNIVSSFARWLAKHPELIRSLSIQPTCISVGEVTAMASEVMQHLIEFGLQAVAISAGRLKPQMRLRSYTSSVPPTAAMLAALPAATLTRLDLNQLDNSNWYLGLKQLTCLQQMTLNMLAVEPQHPAATGCLTAASSLKLLTKLELHRISPQLDTKVLPVQLQELNLLYECKYEPSWDESVEMVVDLQHLTHLRQLQLTANELAAGSSLPCNLSCLTLTVCGWEEGVDQGLRNLSHLTSVELDIQYMDREALEPFKQLTQLERLKLNMGWDAHFLEVANAWDNLPLCSLLIAQEGDIPHSDFVQLMQRIGAATSLTELDVRLPEIYPGVLGAEKLAVCQYLSTLTRLQQLTLFIGFPDAFEQQDAQHLAALTTLTSLDLSSYSNGPYIDATTLSLLAVKLTGLKILSIRKDTDYEHEVNSMAAIPVIGRLTALEVLRLEELPSEAAHRGLQLLTDLTRLTELDGFEEAGEEALQAFWNSIKSCKNGES